MACLHHPDVLVRRSAALCVEVLANSETCEALDDMTYFWMIS